MNLPLRLTGRRTSHRGPSTGVFAFASIVILAVTSGCTCFGTSSCCSLSSVNPMKSSCVTDMKGRVKARSIWARDYAHCYRKHCNYRDVREGFIDGFMAACKGNDGCPPLFAPEDNHCSLFGRERCTSAWYEGYPIGAVAAEKCGACNWATSRCNPALLSCNKGPQCNPGCQPCSPTSATPSCGCNSAASVPAFINHGAAAAAVDMPMLNEGETIVPGSYQENSSIAPVPAKEQPVAPEPDRTLGKAETVAPAVVKPATLEPAKAPAAHMAIVPKSNGQLIEEVQPINWDLIDQIEQGVEAVNYHDN